MLGTTARQGVATKHWRWKLLWDLKFKPQDTQMLKPKGDNFHLWWNSDLWIAVLFTTYTSAAMKWSRSKGGDGAAFIFLPISTIFFSQKETLFHCFVISSHYLRHHSFLPQNPIFGFKYRNAQNKTTKTQKPKPTHLNAHRLSHTLKILWLAVGWVHNN